MRSSRSLCFDEALKRLNKKTAKDSTDIPPNIRVLASINGFSVWLAGAAFQDTAILA